MLKNQRSLVMGNIYVCPELRTQPEKNSPSFENKVTRANAKRTVKMGKITRTTLSHFCSLRLPSGMRERPVGIKGPVCQVWVVD